MAGTVLASTIKHDVSGAATTFRDGGGNEIGRLNRSFASFNQNTTTVLASFNISSVNYFATGRTTFTFAAAFSDSYYSATGMCGFFDSTNDSNFEVCGFDRNTAGPTASAFYVANAYRTQTNTGWHSSDRMCITVTR